MRSPSADGHAAQPEAFLIDVYDTIVTCDFGVLRRELPAAAGAAPKLWNEAFDRLVPDLSCGRITMAQAFGQILADCGVRPEPDLIMELARREGELIAAASRLYGDVTGFLRAARSRGVGIALVSNCLENTRPMLSALGVSALVDAVVLSCEVGCAKPDTRIYQYALDQLGVTARGAVFIDDQPANCAAAAAMGMTALQIARGTAQLLPPAPGTRVISSLSEASAYR
jgi:putative hydrolase of the HAD superfamily